MLKAITDFGDLGVLLPVAAVVALWFLAARSMAALWWWLAAVTLCAGCTAVLKIYFFACHGPYALTSPSGHSSFSALIYGALAVIVATSASAGWQRFMIVAAAAGLVAAIAASRHSLAAHGTLEIVCGLAVGFVSLGVFVPRLCSRAADCIIAAPPGSRHSSGGCAAWARTSGRGIPAGGEPLPPCRRDRLHLTRRFGRAESGAGATSDMPARAADILLNSH